MFINNELLKNKTKILSNKILLMMVFVLISLLFACNNKMDCEVSKPYNYIFDAFNTKCSISLYGVSDEEKANGICKSMAAQVQNIDKMFSKTNPASDVYRINHRKSNEVLIHSDVAYVMKKCPDYYKWSGGKFDISAGTLFDLWDVGNKNRIPSIEEINEARKHCGNYSYEIVDSNIKYSEYTNKIILHGDEKTQYDLNALVKGFACDKLREMYGKSEEFEGCLINLDENICVIGKVSGREHNAFNIGLKKPFSDDEILTTIPVVDTNVFVTSSYKKYSNLSLEDYPGRVVHHIIDPTTGYPSMYRLNSITIITQNGLLGDYLSTASFLLGSQRSRKLMYDCRDYFKDDKLQIIYIDLDDKIFIHPDYVKQY